MSTFDELDADCAPKKNALKSASYSDVKRPQEIFTPLSLIERYVPWPIYLDPCACDASPVVADVKYYGPPKDSGGLVLPWLDRTYCNPPFKDLKLWLARAQDQAREGARITVLAPVRTHRAWFRAAMHSARVTQWLDPVKFEGYNQVFPAPLCLLFWGPP